MKFLVNGSPGVTINGTHGELYYSHGDVLDTTRDGVPGGWTPPPDSWLLYPLDATAQTALKTAINAKLAAIAPAQTAPGIGCLDPNIRIWPWG